MLSRQEIILIHKIEEQIQNRQELIASGSLKDYAEYRENVGFISALKTAIELVNETNKEITGGER